MNKEAFKLLIASQFREKNAAIHSLMIGNTDMFSKDKRAGCSYLPTRTLICKEFDTILSIDTFWSPELELKFQIRFMDTSKLKLEFGQKLPKHFDLLENVWFVNPYYHEEVMVKGDVITLALYESKLLMQDYVYKFSTPRVYRMVEIDVGKGAIKALDGSSSSTASLSDFYKQRNAKFPHYHDFIFEPKLIHEIEALASRYYSVLRFEDIAFSMSFEPTSVRNDNKSIALLLSEALTRLKVGD